jgi:hypothetical protein
MCLLSICREYHRTSSALGQGVARVVPRVRYGVSQIPRHCCARPVALNLERMYSYAPVLFPHGMEDVMIAFDLAFDVQFTPSVAASGKSEKNLPCLSLA